MKESSIMGLKPKAWRNTTTANKDHKKHPYLLSGLDIVRPNQVWANVSFI